MSKAIEAGIPKMRIEEAAARSQARIDSGEQTIVGVNKYRLAEEAAHRHPRCRQHSVRRQQIDRLKRLRAERDEAQCQPRSKPSPKAPGGDGNLLALAVDAARA